MALRSWTPDLGFLEEKVVRSASVSTSLSLELCTFPTTLGSSVAAEALEQLFVVEKSLQGDYFKCNEEVKTFLKDIAIAVKKLEEMRKNTIELLEIESMELSRLYFLLETVPFTVNREVEECVRDARKLNLLEIDQMRKKIAKMDNEAEFLKKRINDLKESNEVLGEKQEELSKQHAKFVLLLNHTLEEKATATLYIDDTCTKLNFEREEIILQKQCLQEVQELLEKHKEEYLLKKDLLASQMKDFKEHCETMRKETYNKKKELTRLQNKIIKMKQTVTTSTMVLNDHNLEIARLQEEARVWERKVEDIRRICSSLEKKLCFFVTHKKNVDSEASNEKIEYLERIQQIGEKLHKVKIENKDLRERLHTALRQYKIVLMEEDTVYLQKRKVFDENQKQLEFISQKENFLSQREADIKNMEEGYSVLQGLHQATKEIYRKQVKILSDNLERESQRCVVTQWKIACARKRHARWLLQIKVTIENIISKIELAEERRVELLKETRQREMEINDFVTKIEVLTSELKNEEMDFVTKEKKLIQELSKYEDLIIRETQMNKEKEEELVESVPQLQKAEETYLEKHRCLKELHGELSALKQEESLLNNYIFQFTRDYTRYLDSTDYVKQELKQLRNQEYIKTRGHFEILKNLENEICVHDQKATLLILENKKLKEHLAYLKNQIQLYREKSESTVKDSGHLSWQLIAQHKKYSDLLREFQVAIKELVSSGEKTLQEISALIEKLQNRDERIECISTWLQEDIQRLRFLIKDESGTDLCRLWLGKKKKKHSKNVHIPTATCRRTTVRRSPKIT
ncbi:coiled-coil domain-containing protein 175 [Nannospalax galili]|uniref:coiled-coil domain-containing protein 175 n=1 Tax=Nannospalax galili TaxID=1026970 RepID=UPI0004ED4110|nr:coiled-coil domain-containing protein 175 [Nannospalax galili]